VVGKEAGTMLQNGSYWQLQNGWRSFDGEQKPLE
jgi:hypothetical protein